MCIHIFLHSFFRIKVFPTSPHAFDISAQNLFSNIEIHQFHSINLHLFPPAEPDFSELHPRDDDNRFSWSGRFAPSLPRPREEYTSAQRHSHFRSYFGYMPGEDGNGNKSSNTRAAAGGSRQIFFFFFLLFCRDRKNICFAEIMNC